MRKLERAVSLVTMLALANCATMPDKPEIAVADPQPDGSTQCFEQARLPFYHAANTALLVDKEQANNRKNGEALAGFGILLTIATLRVGGVGGQIARGVGAAAAVAGTTLAVTAQTDQGIINRVTFSFNALVQCRQAEARQVRADVRARRLRSAESRDRLRGLHDLMVTDADLARRVNLALAQRNRVYVEAASNIDTDPPKDPVERRKFAEAKQTIQSCQHSLSDQASLIDKAAQTIVVSETEPTTRFG